MYGESFFVCTGLDGRIRLSRELKTSSNPQNQAKPVWLVSLFGPPGAGKTTVGDWLSSEQGYTHLPIGRLLRTATSVSEIGLDLGDIEHAIKSGRSINDGRLVSWLDQKIEASEVPVVVDGYPRVKSAVDPFNRLVERISTEFRVVILHLNCLPETSAERIRLRRRSDDFTTKLDSRYEEYLSVQRPLLEEICPLVDVVDIEADVDLDHVLHSVATALRLR